MASLVYSPTPSSVGADTFTSIPDGQNSREASISNITDYVQQSLLLDLPATPTTTHDSYPLFQPLLLNHHGEDDDGPELRSLPDQVLHIILSMVDVRDRLCSLPMVCTRFRDLVLRHRHSLWNKLHLPPCDGMAYRLVHAWPPTHHPHVHNQVLDGEPHCIPRFGDAVVYAPRGWHRAPRHDPGSQGQARRIRARHGYGCTSIHAIPAQFHFQLPGPCGPARVHVLLPNAPCLAGRLMRCNRC